MEDYTLHQIDVGNRLANYIYLLQCKQTGKVAAIDPTEAAPVLKVLETKRWQLDVILTTHHHHDHVGGNGELKRATGCTIVGFAGDAHRVPEIDRLVSEGDSVYVGALTATILEIPGHTSGHIAYFFEKQTLLFSGDTLFSLGCGRMFEGNAQQMHHSLQKIAALPGDTIICAAHEYTVDNAAFALTIDGENNTLHQRSQEAKAQRTADEPTVPVTLAAEKAANPFLRCHTTSIRQSLDMLDAEDYQVFEELRKRKNCF